MLITGAVDVLATDDVVDADEVVFGQADVRVLLHGNRVFPPVKHEVLGRIRVYAHTRPRAHLNINPTSYSVQFPCFNRLQRGRVGHSENASRRNNKPSPKSFGESRVATRLAAENGLVRCVH